MCGSCGVLTSCAKIVMSPKTAASTRAYDRITMDAEAQANFCRAEEKSNVAVTYSRVNHRREHEWQTETQVGVCRACLSGDCADPNLNVGPQLSACRTLTRTAEQKELSFLSSHMKLPQGYGGSKRYAKLFGQVFVRARTNWDWFMGLFKAGNRAQDIAPQSHARITAAHRALGHVNELFKKFTPMFESVKSAFKGRTSAAVAAPIPSVSSETEFVQIDADNLIDFTGTEGAFIPANDEIALGSYIGTAFLREAYRNTPHDQTLQEHFERDEKTGRVKWDGHSINVNTFSPATHHMGFPWLYCMARGGWDAREASVSFLRFCRVRLGSADDRFRRDMTYKFFLFDRYMKNKIKTYNTIVVRNQAAQPNIHRIKEQLRGARGMTKHYQRSQSMYGKVLPQCIPGGLSSRKRNCKSLIATARRLGAAQIFGTFTMNSKWNELLSRFVFCASEQRFAGVKQNPTTTGESVTTT